MTATSPTIDYDTIKTRQRDTWASGDYAVIGTTLQIVGENLCEAVDVAAGERVLDVAAGNGNASLAAARRGCEVTASDYVTALLDGTLARAASEGLTIEAREADAEALPFPDASFDVVLSTFGVMFSPNQEHAAAELLRVCRPGGRIGLANWTPAGFIGQMFKTVGQYVPPAAGISSPLAWGTESRLAELFGTEVQSLDAPRRHFVFRYTGSTTSAPTTGRRSKPSPSSTTRPARRSSASFSPWPTNPTRRRPARCGSQVSTSKSWP
jgi:SAM-dependent methyltransferase